MKSKDEIEKELEKMLNEATLLAQYPIASMMHEYLRKTGRRYHASDSVTAAMGDDIDSVREKLIGEMTAAFKQVLYTAVIDTDNDPNSNETAHRLAKMYINELLGGRYSPTPKITAFPNDKAIAAEDPSKPAGPEAYHFNNLLVVQSPFISVCSHHWQPVKGTAYVGIIPGAKVIGLSKYTRLIQHIAAAGTLQEELTVDIVEQLIEYTGSEDVATVVFARHGCCENRGIGVPNSNTVTAEMRGLFMEKGKLREEFYDNVKMLRREKGE
ncbi:MAG: GTP cyclohydrolase I [Actinobacteria bacterium]|nr:GTP cyclohydrolase I [Actinomycetota bacterium]MCA1806283.1 GTP cyclohydrolase I [Actinomycetota bacterium]